MLKVRQNILFIFFVTMIISTVFNVSNVKAADYYLGVYPNGEVAYLDDSSIRSHEVYSGGELEGIEYSCNVKSVNEKTRNFVYIQYEIWCGQTASISKDGNRVYATIRGPHDYLEKNPVENNLLNYIMLIDRHRKWFIGG